eukprot:262272_1
MTASFFFILLVVLTYLQAEPNPPNWPSSVYVLNSSAISYAQQVADAIKSNGQFSDKRYALLFKPGTYNGLNINVGYYTSLIGLGATPQDVKISNIICQNSGGGALVNFWRSIENIYTKPTQSWNGGVSMLWAVSQAAPMRRVYVDGHLDLWEGSGYSSGGYISDSIVTGGITSGSQQQYYIRNTNMGSWNGGVWNMVFQGTQNAPKTQCPGHITTLPNTPVIAEKPFITIDSDGKYTLNIPKTEYNKVGSSDFANQALTKIDFSNVYVATSSDTAATINSKLSAGEHVILSPGEYNLNNAISITKSNTVLIGIGFPTLISLNGNAVIEIGVNGESVDGVRVGAFLLQAGEKATKALLQFGPQNGKVSASNPAFLYDIFARVGGATNSNQVQVQTDIMVQINSDNVIFDGSWLWRADHDTGGSVKDSHNPCVTGFQANGNNITTYGLAVEHTLGDLVQWNGNNGKCYFYQSELPYDVTQQNYGDKGYVGFRVNNSVTSFEGYGIGVYSYFRDYDVTV